MDEKAIYFVTGGTIAAQKAGTNNLMKMPLEGGAPTILFKGGELIPGADTIAVDESHVYFAAGGLRKISKDGGEALLLTPAFMPSEIVLDEENIYWKPFVGEGMPPAPIFAISKKGGEPKTLTDARLSANGLCVDDKFIYWSQTDGIYRAAKTGGGGIEKIYAAPAGEIASDLKADVESFYFLQGTSKRDLYKFSKSGGEAKVLARAVSNFWLGADEIVFQRYIGSFDIALFRVAKDGGGETELDRDGYLSDLIIGKDKIYFSDVINIHELEK